MAAGSLTIRLRPLRLAFLIDSIDRRSISTAIEAASFLWGGQFNPILPRLRRLPASWRRSVGKHHTAQHVFDAYLETFDPDFVVTVGSLESADLKFPNREVIKCSAIMDPIGEDGTPGIGVGLFELLEQFASEELKFVRRQPVRIRLPKIGGPHRLFLASVFGSLSGKLEALLATSYGHLPDVEWSDCSIDNFWEFLAADNLFIRRLGSLYVRPLRRWHHRGDVLDPNEPLDLLNYWNLRAVGWNIIPVPKEASTNSGLLKFAAAFVDENAFSYRANPDLYNHTTILGSRTVAPSDVEEFGKRLKPLLAPPKHKHDWKVSYQFWFPRIWDEWAHETDGVDPCELEVREEQHEFTDSGKYVSFRSLMPDCASPFGGHGQPRCANDVELRVSGSHFFPAQVIPEGDWRIARAAGAFDFSNWRCGKRGLVYLPEHKDWVERIEVVPAEQVFAAWLETRGWKPALSDKGHIARQMLKHLGGDFGIRLLTREGVVELLSKLRQGRTMHEEAFRGAVAEIANRQKFKLPAADQISAALLESRMIQPGLELQCPHCRQHSWYSVKEADYEFRCPKCLEQFALPAHDLRSISWAYRAIGPFSLPQQAYGVYSVLLTLHFFTREFGSATTPILSFTAAKATSSIEADLGLFFRESKYRSTRTNVVFAECKTFNEFKKPDADRMLLLASEFPGAVLVFATLRKSLTDREQRLLRRVANRGRRYWKADQPYNPVLVLTGNELLTDQKPRRVWEELGGTHAAHARRFGDARELVALADDTQQIYLGMKPWYQWLDERMPSRRRRASKSPPRPATSQQRGESMTVSFPVSLRMTKR